MSEMNQLIENVVKESLTDDKLEDIIRKHVDQAVEDAVRDAVHFGNVRHAIRDKLDEMLVPAIEAFSLDDANVKLEPLLIQLATQSTLADRKSLLENFAGLVSAKPEDGCVMLDDLVNIFTKHVEATWDCDGREIDLDDEPTYVPINCGYNLELAEESPYPSKYSTEEATLDFFVCDEEDESQTEKYNRRLRLWRWTRPEMMHYAAYSNHAYGEYLADGWHISSAPPVTIDGLASLTPFDIMVSRMATSHIPLNWNGERHHDTFEAFPEAEPEASFQ